MRVFYTTADGEERELGAQERIAGFDVVGGRVEAEPGDDDDHVRRVRDRLLIFVALCEPWRLEYAAADAAWSRGRDALMRGDAAAANRELPNSRIRDGWPLLSLFLLTCPEQCPPMHGGFERKTGAIPAELRAERRWFAWAYDASRNKIPRDPLTRRAMGHTNPANWIDFDAALAAAAARKMDGVGFALGDGWAGVDLDDCIGDDGAISDEARAIVEALDSYAEVSPSGRGVKVFVKCAAPCSTHTRKGLEVYGTGRYFAVTGRHLPGTPTTVEERTEAIAALIAREFCDGTRPNAPARGDFAAAGRNNRLTSLAGAMRRRGASPEAILAALRHENAGFASPLEDREVEQTARSVSRYEPASDDFKRTDKGNAEFFAAHLGDFVRFDHRKQRWLAFAGHRWVPDVDGAMMRYVMRAVDARLKIAADGNEPDKADRVKWALNSQSRRALEAALALAKVIEPISDAGDSWDADPWLLGVENGVVDLRTGELLAGLPEDRVTMSAGAPYDPAAKCPLWERTVREIFGGDDALAAYVQRALGYSLTGDCREECLFFCWGDGANGKGTLMNTFARVVGDYGDNLSATALEHIARSAGGATPEIAKLPGRRFLSASEFNDASRLNEARLKALTGRDPVTARALYGQEFTFTMAAKIWLATNARPIVRDDSEGFWRRMQLIPFTQSFAGREDKTLKDKLREEAAGILAWSVRGALAWQREGLGTPAAVRAATEDYRRESDPLAPFLDARCVIAEGARVQSAKLFDAYLRWCDATHERARMNRTNFGKQVKKRFAYEEPRGVTFYLGLGLRDSVQDDGVPF